MALLDSASHFVDSFTHRGPVRLVSAYDASAGRRAAKFAQGSGPAVEVRSPFDNSVLASVPSVTAENLDGIYARARAAGRLWSQRSVDDRIAVFEKFIEVYETHIETLLDLAQMETGRSRRDTVLEVSGAPLIFGHYAKIARRLLDRQVRMGAMPVLTHTTVEHRPKGVVTIISPWNFTVTLSMADSLPAWLAGNAVVIKPDSQTCLSTLYLRQLALEAGVPADLYQVVVGDPGLIGDGLIDRSDHVSFTGSVASGRKIAARAAGRLISSSMELGGKNGLIVLPDADIDRLLRGFPGACFTHSGQVCLSIEKAFIPRALYPDLVARLRECVDEVTQGATLDFSVDIGSMVNAAQVKRAQAHVDDAVAKGANILIGGHALPELGPYFFAPTVLTDVPSDARVASEETFGPVVSLYPYDDLDSVIDNINSAEYGLNVSIYGRDVEAAAAVGRRIDVGSVNINDGFAAAIGSLDAPSGGVKSSGLGHRHGDDGLLRYTDFQTIAIQRALGPTENFGLPNAVYGWVMKQVIPIMRKIR